MPREQIQRLNKRPQVDTKLGEVGVGRTEVVAMPTVAPAKTSGAKLAEAFGMAVKTGAKVYQIEQDKKQKRQSIFESVEGNRDGVALGQTLKDEADKLPLEQRAAYLKQGLQNHMEILKGSDVTDSYLRATLNAVVSSTDSYTSSLTNELNTINKHNKALDTVSKLQTDYELGVSHSDMMETIKVMNDVGNKEAGKMYVKSIAAIIKEKAQNNPSFNWQEAVDNKLKIVSKDGTVNYAKHPEYGTLIDNLESSLSTLSNTRLEAKSKVDKKIAVNTTKNILTTLFNPAATPEEITQAKDSILTNEDIFSVTQYKTLQTTLRDVEENVGYATTSNPVIFSKFKASVLKGDLNLNTLAFLKPQVTKDEYKQLASSILQSEEEAKDISKTSLKESMKDLEISGRRMVAKTNALGTFLDDNGPAKSNMFETEWNRWVVNYTETNRAYPDYETMVKAQQDIVKRTNMLFEDVDQSGIKDVLEFGKVEDIQKALQYQAVKEQEVVDYKKQLLTGGTSEELKDAFDRGILSQEDFQQAKPKEEEPIKKEEPGFFESLFGLRASEDFEISEELKPLEDLAKKELGEEVYNQFIDEGSRIKALFENVNVEPQVTVPDMIQNTYNESPVKDILSYNDVIKIAQIESSLGQDPKMNKGKYYKGVFQLSEEEGGDIDREDNEANIKQALDISLPRRHKQLTSELVKVGIAKNIDAFDLYMAHQQGARGYVNILKNPNKKAKHSQGLGDITNAELVQYFKNKWSK